MKNNCCWVYYKSVIIRNQTTILEIILDYILEIVLDLSNYATKKELDHATGVDTSDLATEKVLLLWKLKLAN